MPFVGEATGVFGLLDKGWSVLRDRLDPARAQAWHPPVDHGGVLCLSTSDFFQAEASSLQNESLEIQRAR